MLDDRDRKILGYLQVDATLSVSEMADKVALSVSACSRRIQRLEDEGYILRRVAILDRARMGLPTTVFALIKTTQHSDEWTEIFKKTIAGIGEVTEAHRLTGHYDYLLKIVLPRAEHYDVVYKAIVRKLELFDITASISMEIIKSGDTLPVTYAD